MARKTTTSRPSGARGAQSASSRPGKASSSNRRRSGRGPDGARPAQQGRQSFTEADREYRKYERREEEDRTGPPDVLLDVPELKVDLIHLELDDLDAHVALKAQVLNLVRLDVGVDVHLSRVKLDIKGVQAEVVLKARLDHVAAIVDRLMTSLDRNPELVKGLGRAVSEVGRGAGAAVEETGEAAKEVGKGAGAALEGVGRGAGAATGDIGEAAGQAVADVGRAAGQATGDLDRLVGGVGQAAVQAGRGAGQAAGQPNGGGPAVAGRAGQVDATEAAVRTAEELGIDLGQVEGTGGGGRITVKDVRRARKA